MPDQQEISGPNRWTRANAQDAIYIAALILVSVNVLFYLGWLLVDIPARFFGVHGSWLGNDWHAYLAAPIIFKGWLLYLEALLSAAALYGMIRRRRWALLVLGVVLLSGTYHWVFGANNPHFATGRAETYVFAHATVFLACIALVAMNWSWGGLNAAPGRSDGKGDS